MNAPQVLELPLDDALLKVLSSESRREILRLLAERRMTGAEMAGRLNLGKPAVSEHLKKLTEAGLIERQDDPERRWVYYNLSARGKSILEPQRVRFYLVMAVASLALVLGMALALGIMVFMQGQGAAESAAVATDDDGSGLGGLAGSPALVDTNQFQNTEQGQSAALVPEVPAVAPPTAQPQIQAVTVVTGALKKACPAGQDCSAIVVEPDPTAAYVLVLANGAIAPPLDVHTLYVYHASGVDAVKHTITVQPIVADALGNIAADLGAGANLNLSTLANSAEAIPLSTGGALLPLPADVAIPAASDDVGEPAAAAGGPEPVENAPTDSVDDTTEQASAGTDASTAATSDQSADAASAQQPAPAAQRPPAADSAVSVDPSLDLVQSSPAIVDVEPAISTLALPLADSLTMSQGATDAGGPIKVGVGDAESSAAAAGAAAPSGGQSRDVAASAYAARQPSDSTFLPFVALVGAALLVGLVRRRA